MSDLQIVAQKLLGRPLEAWEEDLIARHMRERAALSPEAREAADQVDAAVQRSFLFGDES